MKLEDIDTSTTAGERTEWLSDDAAQLALFKAIRDIKFGLPTDDKLILEGLRNAGLWIARYQPERSPPIGPGEVWVAVGPGPKLESERCPAPASGRGGPSRQVHPRRPRWGEGLMDGIEKRAREILDSHVDGYWLEDQGRGVLVEEALTAIIAALTPPEGYVLVPVEPTDEEVRVANEAQQDFFDENTMSMFFSSGHYNEESIRHALRAVRADCAEVPNVND